MDGKLVTKMKNVLFPIYAALSIPLLVVAVALARPENSFNDILSSFAAVKVLIPVLCASLAFFALAILEYYLKWIRTRSLRSGIYICILYQMSIITIAAISKYNLYFVFDGMLYGVFLGVISATLRHQEDFSFVANGSIEVDIKKARLDKSYDLLVKSLKYFSTLYITGLIGGAFFFVKNFIEKGQMVEVVSITVVVSYLTIGVVLGVYVRIFRMIQTIKEKYIDIGRKPDKKIIIS